MELNMNNITKRRRSIRLYECPTDMNINKVGSTIADL